MKLITSGSWQVEVVRLALASLTAHKMRGALTVLAIVIGITSVVGMVSLVEGVNRSLHQQLGALGTDTIRVRRWEANVFVGDIPDSLRKRRKFTERDAEGLRESCPSLLGVAISNATQERLRFEGKESRLVRVVGIDPHYLLVSGFQVDRGRPFTTVEIESGARVVLAGKAVSDELFEPLDPIGQRVTVGGQKFEVVGELAPRGNLLGQNLDEVVLVPRPALRRFLGANERIRITAKPIRPELLETALEEMRISLRRTRGLRPRDTDDFALMTQGSLLDLWNQLTGALFIVVVAIASVALLVGGVGVMNIMLVSVTERTREIGVRKALGATRGQILGQFLAEAMFLTGSGGALGVVIGVGIGKLVQVLTPLPSFVPVWAYVVALAVSMGVGLFFGMWPAVRAARLDPVDALRYE
jgi:putative ABC transport system permease protein